MTNRTSSVAALYDGHKQFMAQHEDSLAQLLPPTLPARRLILVALTHIAKNRDLLKCSHSSIFQSLLVAAELGLEPSGTLGHFYLVPYGGEASGQIGFRGYVELAVRCGAVEMVEPIIVYEGEQFVYDAGAGTVEHMVRLDVPRGDENIVAAYAKATLPSGRVVFHLMTRDEIDKRRAAAKTKNVWAAWYPEMAMKTVVKGMFLRGKVRLPPGSMLSTALELDRDDATAKEQAGVLPAASQIVVEDVTRKPGRARPPKPAGPARTGDKPDWREEPTKNSPEDDIVIDGDLAGGAGHDKAEKEVKTTPRNKQVRKAPSTKAMGSHDMIAPSEEAHDKPLDVVDALDKVAIEHALTVSDIAAASSRILERTVAEAEVSKLTIQERLEVAHRLGFDLA